MRANYPPLMNKTLVGLLAVVFSLVSQPARAETTLRWESFTAAAYNPLGLITILSPSLKHTLYQSENPLFSQNFVEGTAILASSPAYGILGYQIQIQPLSVLRLRMRHEQIGYYGTFGHIQSFQTPFVDFSDDQLSENADRGRATTGSRLTLTALLQAKIGPIAVRNHTQFVRMNLDLPLDEQVFYSPFFDHLLQSEQWFVQNDVDLLFVHPSIVLGLRYTLQAATFDADIASEDPHGPAQRVGPLIVLPVYKDEGLLDQISLILLVNWHLSHAHRAGQQSPQWLPYTGLAVSFEGALF